MTDARRSSHEPTDGVQDRWDLGEAVSMVSPTHAVQSRSASSARTPQDFSRSVLPADVARVTLRLVPAFAAQSEDRYARLVKLEEVVFFEENVTDDSGKQVKYGCTEKSSGKSHEAKTTSLKKIIDDIKAMRDLKAPVKGSVAFNEDGTIGMIVTEDEA